MTSSRRATAVPFLPGAGAGAGAARWAKGAVVQSLRRCGARPTRCSEALESCSPHPPRSESSSRTWPAPGTGAWPQAWGRGVVSHPHPTEAAWAAVHALTKEGRRVSSQNPQKEKKLEV